MGALDLDGIKVRETGKEGSGLRGGGIRAWKEFEAGHFAVECGKLGGSDE